MKTLFAIFVAFVSMNANATQFKCYGSKYQTYIQHFFADGYTILDVNKNTVSLKYYHINTVAKQTTLEIEAKYKIKGIQGGNGALKGMAMGGLVDSHSFPGDSIRTIHFSPSLFENTPASGVAGKFVFPAHGYAYDWNICYNIK